MKPGAIASPAASISRGARRARGVRRIDQRRDFSIFDRDIRFEARRATAIDHDAIANNQVIFHVRDYSRLATLSANGEG